PQFLKKFFRRSPSSRMPIRLGRRRTIAAGVGYLNPERAHQNEETSMSAHAATTEAPASRRVPAPLNGVNTAALFATIDVVKNQPQLGAFQFRANGEWLGGTHMRSTMSDFSGAGGEHSHKAAYTAYADHPAVLCG